MAFDKLHLQLNQPLHRTRCLAVEDSRAGIASAVAAELPTLAMAGVIQPDEQLRLGASAVISDFAQWYNWGGSAC